MTQEQLARRSAAFWTYFDRQQRRRNRVIITQVVVTLLILLAQVLTVWFGCLPSEANYGWMLLIIGWGLFCILWMKWVNRTKFDWDES